ncbi:MAG TPA: sensor histidine kinase [Clostridiales bacterium]|nr:sensor histidine kinase [Clostridiales bacterium]
MRKLIDKVIILLVSLIFYLSGVDSSYMVVPVLTVMIISAVLSYLENDKVTLALFALFLLLCLRYPEFLAFIPLFCYDAAFMNIKGNYWLFSFLPFAVHHKSLPFPALLLEAAFIPAAVVLKNRTIMLQNMEEEYRRLRDNAAEISLKLEKQNKELIERQDYEIHLATITERNRIARDIHDNVGHLLSRSILQIGALMAVNKEKSIADNLRLIKETLSEAMDSIRASVHNLHEDSVDLKNEIQKLINSFTFCPVDFQYDMNENPDKKIRYCFIAVVKEALSNIMKHSNATEAAITMVEHPAIYQLLIKDNGTNASYNRDNGIGLQSITDRITSLGGNIHISTEKGFRIFISIPKISV